MSFLDDARTRELWEKVKAGLSGKQSKLTGAPGQVVGFGADGAAVAVRGWSNRNLLDNWYFPDPVNQKLQKEYNGRGYAIDRWSLSELTGKAVVQSGSIQINGPNIQIFLQHTELQATPGKIFTISALAANGVFASATATMIGDGNHSHQAKIGGGPWYVDCWELDGKLIPRIYKVAEEDTPVDLVAVKLELGSQQTLAHKDASGNWVLNDPPPDKTLEMLKCQRYQVCVRSKQAYSMFGFAYGFTESIAVAFVPVPCNLRANPTLSTNGEFELYNLSASNVTISNIRIDQWSTNGVRLLAEVASPVLTPGAIYQIREKNHATAYILVDANL